ncbi:hypothetical protein SAMN05421684_8036 [Asanoa ishikariensis]|uniref:Uncharacterized protein n=1 Tax=Asanoa ishikariensis TaxID=137265 RepID=A0A1H3UTZ8_9ACTN|nr:hypothetical protein SAMN05421684_8036 [Asanoa ishikariensis]
MLGVLAVVSHRTDAPTVREQRDLAAAIRVVDSAMGISVGQAGPDAVPVIMPITVDEGCRITPFRDGATATGVVRFFTKDAAGLLGRLGAGYPAAYEAKVSTDGKALRADAGGFVALRGKVIAPGEVQVTVTTGCRPSDAVEAVSLLPEYPQHAKPGEVLSVLGAASVEDSSVAFARCPSGRPATTASAVGHQVTAGPAAAREHDHGVAVVDTAEVYAYKRGASEAVVVLSTSERDARVYVTELC